MQIRKAKTEDLKACLAMDASYVTAHVWQLIEQVRGEETLLTFRQARLPRPLRVEYPYTLSDLATDLDREECFLVAEEDGELWGFLDLAIADRPQIGWLKHLVVIEPHRRRRIGTRLLQAGISWCSRQGLQIVMADCQTKNYPAIAMYRKNGLSFCGYNDLYYPNKDIALFFAYTFRK